MRTVVVPTEADKQSAVDMSQDEWDAFMENTWRILGEWREALAEQRDTQREMDRLNARYGGFLQPTP